MIFWRIFVLFIINNFLSYTRFFALKRLLLISTKIEVGKNTKIVGPIYFGNRIKIKIGNDCWIGKNINIDGNGEVYIGNNVDIGPHVTVNTGGHEIGDFKRRAGKGVTNKIVIGDGTWIGTKVLIVNNTLISSGCMIAAGSVVVKNIEKNSLAAGVPAKIKKHLN